MADAAAFCKQVMRPDAQGHLFCSALTFRKCYKIISRTRLEAKSDSDDGEGITIRWRKKRKKIFYKDESVRLQYT